MPTLHTLDNAELVAAYAKMNRDIQFKFGCDLLDRLDIQPGMSVLDLGSGTGDLGLESRRRVGETGLVVGYEPAADRVNTANDNAAAYDNVSYHVGSTKDLKAITGQYDRITINFVWGWVDNQEETLAYCRSKLLRKGGKIGIAGGSGVEHPANVKLNTLSQPPFDQHEMEGAAHFLKRNALSAQITGAGFSDVLVDEYYKFLPFDSVAHVREFLEASSTGNSEYVGYLPAGLQAAAKRKLDEAFAEMAEKASSPAYLDALPLEHRQPAKDALQAAIAERGTAYIQPYTLLIAVATA